VTPFAPIQYVTDLKEPGLPEFSSDGPEDNTHDSDRGWAGMSTAGLLIRPDIRDTIRKTCLLCVRLGTGQSSATLATCIL
jgi:hypothetical protein